MTGGFRGQSSFRTARRQLIDVGEIAAVEPLLLDDVPDERLLQIRDDRRRGRRLVGRVIGIGDVDRQPPLVMAGEKEFPLRIGGFGYPRRKHVAERRRRDRRRAGAAACADHADDGAAVADVVVQFLQGRVAARFLAEIALHPNQRVARPAGPRQARRAPCRTRSSPPRERRGTPPPSAPCPSRIGNSTANPRATQRLTGVTSPSWRHDRGVSVTLSDEGAERRLRIPLPAPSDTVSLPQNFPAGVSETTALISQVSDMADII